MGLSYPNVRNMEDQSPQTTIDLIVELRERLSSKALTIGRRPSPGTWPITTKKSCRSTPSTGICAGPGMSSQCRTSA